MTGARILAFDTSGPWCAVAVTHGSTVLAACHKDMTRGQAERLMPLIVRTLNTAGVSLDALDAVAVGTGPGNFTGIRLGVSAARGLALSLGRPAIGITALEAAVQGCARPVLAVLDARRGAVYAQRFDTDTQAPPRLVEDPATLPADLPRRGNGPGASAPDRPLAERIARIALLRLDRPQPRPAPLYIRAADATPPREHPPALLP